MKLNLKNIVFTCVGLLVVGLGIIIYFAKKEDSLFLKEGIRVKASVLSTYKNGTRKSRSYMMDIAMFTQGDSIPTVKTDTTGKSPSEKKIDEIFDKIKIKTTMGDYVTTSVNIGRTEFSKYKSGDPLTVVYLKNNPKKVKILSLID